ncbi:MAG: hypothetical protein HN396_17885 [Gemmatimonadales bacterium]|jgi:hypothetical protein|nr:hypothetical protein [Gemmatimonadales bacterium]
MTITKYGVDHAAVQALLDSGECQTEEEAIEKVAHALERKQFEDSIYGPVDDDTGLLEQTGAQTGRTQSKVPNLSNGPSGMRVPVSIMDETDLTAEMNIERAQLSALGKKGGQDG